MQDLVSEAERASTVEEAILTRRSVRRFTAQPVPHDVLTRLLELASRAPSGSNIQPWNVHVVTGAALERLTTGMRRAYLDEEPGHGREYEYYTDPLPSKYLERRRACGWGLYGLLGIGRGDVEKSRAYRVRNYEFFGAPAAMVFTIERDLAIGSWLDYGMFLQNIMLAARHFGLHTCPEASIAEFPRVCRAQLDISDAEIVMCGMALGYIDASDPINTYQPERQRVESFATFHAT